jgi:hypothetical protein
MYENAKSAKRFLAGSLIREVREDRETADIEATGQSIREFLAESPAVDSLVERILKREVDFHTAQGVLPALFESWRRKVSAKQDTCEQCNGSGFGDPVGSEIGLCEPGPCSSCNGHGKPYTPIYDP